MPAVPKQRLAVLVEPLTDFSKRRSDYRSSASGFVVRQDNLLVLSASPNNELYQKLKLNLDDVRRGRKFDNGLLEQDHLLTGQLWKSNDAWDGDPKAAKDKRSPKADLALLQTLTLLQKSMEDDLELNTISREGTRQLLAASDFLARNVAMPEWIQEGLVSFFEIPAPHTYLGFGLPRGDLLRTLLSLPPDGKTFNRDHILSDLATDRLFRLARKDTDAPAVGQAASWALVYYLAFDQRLMQQMSSYTQQ